jgi:ATP synthase F1 gamma subunit
MRATEGEIKNDALLGRSHTVIAIGRKADGYFRFRGYNVAKSFTGFTDSPTYAIAKEVGEFVTELYASGQVDRVELVYTRFISSGTQEVVNALLYLLNQKQLQAAMRKMLRVLTTNLSHLQKQSLRPCCLATLRHACTQQC